MDQRMGLAEVPAHARRVEALGYDGLCVPDAVHDGMLLCQAALSATTRLRTATSVLVAFPRSPMIVALAAWDLQSASGGRFELGLGTQVRGNIVGRYSTPWSAPVTRMGEYVRSLRAIWHAFQEGGRLDFQGEHYTFNRLQPFFNPGPIEAPDIPVWLGGVGPRMTELAGEVADGLMTHPTNTSPAHLREAVTAELARGAERGQRGGASPSILAGGFIATGPDAAAVSGQREHARELLTFLYSTPAYWRSLERYGWRDVGERLHQLTREGKWADMEGAIRDEMLDTLVPQGTYDEIPNILDDWYGGLATHLTFPVPEDPNEDAAAARAIAALREAA